MEFTLVLSYLVIVKGKEPSIYVSSIFAFSLKWNFVDNCPPTTISLYAKSIVIKFWRYEFGAISELKIWRQSSILVAISSKSLASLLNVLISSLDKILCSFSHPLKPIVVWEDLLPVNSIPSKVIFETLKEVMFPFFDNFIVTSVFNPYPPFSTEVKAVLSSPIIDLRLKVTEIYVSSTFIVI